MPLTGAERARRHRQKLKESEATYSTYLSKERERYVKRKEKGEFKSIDSLTSREKRLVRKDWRHKKRDQRARKKQATNLLNDTPPSTPTDPWPIVLLPTGRQKRGRNKVLRNKTKAYREIAILKEQLKKQKRLVDKYKKRLSRQRMNSVNTDSPKSKTSRLLKGQRVTKDVRKTLLFHHALTQGIKDKYNQLRVEKQKQLLAKAVTSSILKKYRLASEVRKTLNLSQRRMDSSVKQGNKFEYIRKPKKNALVDKMKSRVESFLVRDDNSRLKAGKKSTITKGKEKRQRRILTDTLQNLHSKFLAESSNTKMSYALFCRLRPFYVLQPTSRDRETCLCRKHENLTFKLEKLSHVLGSSSLSELAVQLTCSTTNKDCMYRDCMSCKDQTLKKVQEYEPGKIVSWYEWKTKRVEKEKIQNGSRTTVTVTVTVKEQESGTMESLLQDFESDLKKSCKHLYNISHQYRAIRMLKESLTETDIIVHVDFSENYTCKYSSEVQSMHFGASKKQITLHTGVVYVKGATIPFCSISDSMKHGPPAIWGHLVPVLQSMTEKRPTLDKVFFVTDGPTTQYRCKANFYLLASKVFDLGFLEANWNFLEAGHGKGAPDGIGAVIKREADRFVSHGKDIPNAATLHQLLLNADVGIELYVVDDNTIEEIEKEIPDHLTTIPGTMKIHQIQTTKKGELYTRDVSCFCSKPARCSCYTPKVFTFLVPNPAEVLGQQPEKAGDTLPTQAVTAGDDADKADGDLLRKVAVFDESLVNLYCVVTYEGDPYPGRIQDVDDNEIEVSVMHRVGENRFFWPLREDCLWYRMENFITLIPEPSLVTSRHREVEKNVWKAIKLDLGLS